MATTSISINNSANLPIVRWVYLVQDASDVVRMGGISNNVYSTITTAYAAANAIQIALGGANLVAIRVIGRISGASGDLTLTANWNARIAIIGDGTEISHLGTLTLSNAAGSGFTFGTVAIPVFVYNMKLNGGVFTDATGAAGSAGEICIQSNASFLGTVQSQCTNPANVTGSTGAITIIDQYGSSLVSKVTNNMSVAGSAGSIGAINLQAYAKLFIGEIGNVSDFIGATNGSVFLKNVEANSIIKFSDLTITIESCTFNSFVLLTIPVTVSSVDSVIRIEDTQITDYFSIIGGNDGNCLLRNIKVGADAIFTPSTNLNNIYGFAVLEITNSYINNSYSITNPLLASLTLGISYIEIRESTICNIDASGFASNGQTGTAAYVILADGSVLSNFRIVNSSINGGAGGLDATIAIVVSTFSTYIEQPNSGNITINPL